MRISGTPVPPLPAANPAGRTTGGRDAAPEAAPPSESQPHGLLVAAAHSHRSDVAALRQWINHPERRDSLTVPDLESEHKGKGFERAVAAYHAAMPAEGEPVQ